MKQLLLMRHGKSDWNRPGQEDIERPLAARGHKAAASVAAWIKRQALQPDVALVSTARRTLETWQEMQASIGEATTTENQDALYLASPGEILHQIAGVADACETVLVIAHNPGLETLCQLLVGPDSEPDARENLQRGFATAALAVFELAGGSWSTLSADGARLTNFVRPRELD